MKKKLKRARKHNFKFVEHSVFVKDCDVTCDLENGRLCPACADFGDLIVGSAWKEAKREEVEQ